MDGLNALCESLKVNFTLRSINIKEGHRALGMALLEKKDSKLAFLTCDKFSIGTEDTSLDLQGKKLGPSDGILLAGVLKANEIVTSVNLSNNALCGLDQYGDGEGIIQIAEY
mmetsp:Transcript_74830/g.206414  ORF Transcript_74830/g.206414 Transcript_74830/m.206414 type:complete len:112 (-) Transcript_74830:202-537(-)